MDAELFLSVVVTASNNATLLGHCLESVKSSTYRNYELVVVDDASSDTTAQTARRFGDTVIVFDTRQGVNVARAAGYAAARGDIIASIDADVRVSSDTLKKIAAFFATHPHAEVLTGTLSRTHSYGNFASQYKNLYMHYIFSRLPEKVTFVYGSLFAMRKAIAREYASDIRLCGDTLFGQHLYSQGKSIFLVKDIEVEHMKHYSMGALLRNDFEVPFYWAHIFLRYKGFTQMAGATAGFAHASLRQLISVILAGHSAALIILQIAGYPIPVLTVSLMGAWLLLNAHFFSFLCAQRGSLFGVRSMVFTFIDQMSMCAGIIAGFIFFPLNRMSKIVCGNVTTPT